jgi:flagellar biosynthesis/type III secretory pathway M-ring protein FliF/YscJ
MAEDITPAPGGRQVIIIATVIAVVFFTIFIFGLRSCSTSSEPVTAKPKLPAQVVIYSNLDLKDSAMVITRLKELKIPYEIRDEGRSIAVPRARADEARLGLAEKNLPAGGTIGWEIFDQARLGATDFDRRIQFIRAISGELSRTINRISAVEDARVQIVIPETNMFQTTTSPVTASVLLKLNPGEPLTQRQVNGIVHLVAGSVENLKPENITIIDTNGSILSGTGAANVPSAPEEMAITPRVEENAEVVVAREEENAALGIQARLDLENALTSKVQSLLNKIFPPNVTIARVNVDSIKTRKTTVLILVDKAFKMNPSIKKSAFETVSAAVGYDRGRGDKIIMKSIPLRTAGPVKAQSLGGKKLALFTLSTLKTIYRKYGRESAVAIAALFVLVLFSMFRSFGKGKKRPRVEEIHEEAPVIEEEEEEGVPIVDQMKELASQNPELVAQLIKSWVEEEGA